MLLLLLFAVLVGLLSGFYPAMILSNVKPVQVLKSAILMPVQNGMAPFLRQGLVIIQFTISVALIISAIVVYRQVNFLHHKDLGFNKEEIMFFQMRGEKMNRDYPTFKNELLKVPGVSSVSIGYGFPGDATAGDQIIVPMNGEERNMPSAQLMVDYDYIRTLKLQIIAGRDFSKDIPTDSTSAFIINETAVKQMGFGSPENAIGKTLLWPVWESKQPDSLKRGQVIGVVKDFHFKSLYDKLETTVLQIYPQAYWKVAVKFDAGNAVSTIQKVEETWKKFAPDHPIDYTFLDESFKIMYKPEDKLRSLLLIFTCVAIFIGCLGLFGLSAYAAERRRKEIAIRKVLGASVEGIVMLLSRDFIRLVLISLLIASPIAWWSMSRWLQDFPYRLNISWWIFALSGLIAITIAIMTIFFQSIKAALINPVKNLRAE
jgi:putative ABC transport system permease protein